MKGYFKTCSFDKSSRRRKSLPNLPACKVYKDVCRRPKIVVLWIKQVLSAENAQSLLHRKWFWHSWCMSVTSRPAYIISSSNLCMLGFFSRFRRLLIISKKIIFFEKKKSFRNTPGCQTDRRVCTPPPLNTPYFSSWVLNTPMDRSGSVVECLTRDRRAAGSSLTSVTVLCPWARTLILA